jgi:cysteine-rich repeat protein
VKLSYPVILLGLLLAAAGCSDETCGDGTLDPEEICDDGDGNSDTAPGACRTDCTPARCGDGVVDPGEDCDGTSPCNAACRFPGCGNGFVDEGEGCDDGADNSDTAPDACRADCTPARCGDGVLDTGEACDDGAENSDTLPGACRTTCVPAGCGDGVLDPGETCDDGADNDDRRPDACRTTCVPAGCGDGVRDTGEPCDNGAANADDVPGACRTDCRVPACGDGVVDPGEECDDGAANSDTEPDACRRLCRFPTCGDGVRDDGEECDDATPFGEDGCVGCAYEAPACGDPVIDLTDPALWTDRLEYTGTLGDENVERTDCVPASSHAPDAVHVISLPRDGSLVVEAVSVDGSFPAAVEIRKLVPDRRCQFEAPVCRAAADPASPAVAAEPGVRAAEHLRFLVVEAGNGVAGPYRLVARILPPLPEGGPCHVDGRTGHCTGNLACLDPDGDGAGSCGSLVAKGSACDPAGLASGCIESLCIDGVCTDSCGDGLVQEWEECDDGNPAATDNCSASCVVAGRSCEAPYLLNLSPAEGGGFEWRGTNEIGDPGFTASCGDTGNTPHVIGAFTAPEAGNWVFRVQPQGLFSSALSLVTEGCGSGVELACAWARQFSDAPTLRVALGAGETVWPVVSGTGPFLNKGQFVLSVERVECGDGEVGFGEDCDDGNRQSGDGCSESCTAEP